MPEQESIIYSPDTQKKNRVPPGQHLVKDWPVLHYGNVPRIDLSNWTFFIKGLVNSEKRLGYAEFDALPKVKIFSDIHCVTTWSLLDNTWEGPGAGTIASLVDIKPEAGFVIVHGEHGFTANLTMSDFLQEDVLFTFTHNGKPLSPDHGGPVRLVVSRLYFWKSVKWVTGIEFTAEDRPGFWERAGYHNHGDPWKEERRQW
jgi:DMSO/TMAO reductase YedYZ molybdopterin-dependent catalytic subunit